jgi:hypothetical protein
MPSPPNTTMRAPAMSNAAAWPDRASGLRVVVIGAQVAPSYCHASSRAGLPLKPPNSTVRLRALSNTSVWPALADGVMAVVIVVQLVPSYSCVSATRPAGINPPPDSPPNSTVRRRPGSYASA